MKRSSAAAYRTAAARKRRDLRALTSSPQRPLCVVWDLAAHTYALGHSFLLAARFLHVTRHPQPFSLALPLPLPPAARALPPAA